ncbi:MAG: HAD family hydrolase [Phycisphaerales bacterium]|nr:HAD family hydrolase [Phycisphaerales bacterium]
MLRMLMLFDIDATLVTTSRSGMLALGDAGRELFGSFEIDGIDFAGRLDPLIIADLLRANGRAADRANTTAMRDGYRRHLTRRLAAPGIARALPGVHGVVERLCAEPGVTMGLLTGNFEDTGCLKLRACGIDPDRFIVRVWGDESPHDPPQRHHLGAVGLERYRKLHAREARAGSVTIIGDTPHDVECAKRNGARCLAVATGSYSAEQLSTAGADRVVIDMSDVDDVVGWLVGDRGSRMANGQ